MAESTSEPLKKSLNPAIQQQVDAEKERLRSLLSGTSSNDQGINQVARDIVARDIRGDREANRAREARNRATTDALTGQLNRRGFQERIDTELARLRRQIVRSQIERESNGIPQERRGTADARNKIVYVALDLNDLKQANDTGGHEAGDRLIQGTAESLQAASLRPTDIVARTGGDEFVAVLPETDLAGAITWWNRFDTTLQEKNIHISAGIVEVDPNNVPVSFEQADKAMYVAKATYKKEKRERGTSQGVQNKILSTEEAREILRNNPAILEYNKQR